MKFLEKPGVLPIILAMAGFLSLEASNGIARLELDRLLQCKEITIETSEGDICNVENFSSFLNLGAHVAKYPNTEEGVDAPGLAPEYRSVESIDAMGLLKTFNNAIQSPAASEELTKLKFHLGADPYQKLSQTLGVDANTAEAVYIANKKKSIESINHENWMNVASQYIQMAGESPPPPRPIASESLENTIKKIAKEKDVPFLLLLSIAEQESGFNRLAKSSAGAIGLCQVLPSTALWLTNKDANDQDSLVEMEQKLLNPEYNLRMSAKYLKRLATMFSGDLDKILAAYNAGPGKVRKYDGIPPFSETINYVHKVKARVVLNHEEYLVQQPRNNLEQNMLLVQNEIEPTAPFFK